MVLDRGAEEVKTKLQPYSNRIWEVIWRSLSFSSTEWAQYLIVWYATSLDWRAFGESIFYISACCWPLFERRKPSEWKKLEKLGRICAHKKECHAALGQLWPAFKCSPCKLLAAEEWNSHHLRMARKIRGKKYRIKRWSEPAKSRWFLKYGSQ